MQEHPDSALHIISRIDLSQLRHPKTRAKYALLYSQALDKNYIDTDNDSLIRVAVNYYANHGSAVDRARAYYYYSVVKSNASEHEAAVEALVAARRYAEQCDDIYLRGQIYSSLGSLYRNQYSFEHAAEAYAQAVDAFRKCNRREQLMYALYDEGLALSPRGLYSEALACLAEAQKIAIESNDAENILNLASSIGSISILSSPDSVSLSKFKDELFALYDRYTSGAVPFRHYPVVGHLYFREHNLDSAYCYYAEYWASAPAVTSTNIGALAMLSRIEKQRKHYEAAWKYENLYATSSDSLNTVHSNQLIQHLEARYRTKYLERSYASLRAARRYEIATLVLVIVVIAIGCGLIVLSRKRAIAERNRKIAEYEQYIENARAMYGELQSRYDTIRASVKSDDARAETLFGLLGNRIQSLQKLLELASKYENDTPVFYQRFKEYVKVASGNNRQLSKDVIAIADLTCAGIIRYLHQHYPTLSQYELCYCGFICLGFSAESIRILYNHTNTYSIYTMRAKIRAKLNIKNNSLKLETYLLQIMEDLKH